MIFNSMKVILPKIDKNEVVIKKEDTTKYDFT
jgi:hypothetical protein